MTGAVSSTEKRPGSIGSSPSFVVAMVLVMTPELKYSKGSHGRNAAVVTGAKRRPAGCEPLFNAITISFFVSFSGPSITDWTLHLRR